MYLAGSDSWSLSATGTADDAQHSTLATAAGYERSAVARHAGSNTAPTRCTGGSGLTVLAKVWALARTKVDCGRDGVSAISEAQTPHTTRLTDVV